MFNRAIEWFADIAFDKIGTPPYVAASVCIFVAWIIFNTAALTRHDWFDKYPYILLNLVLSAQAMITAPLIMIAQRKAEKRDSERETTQRKADDDHKRWTANMMEAQQSLLMGVDTSMQAIQHALESVEKVISSQAGTLEDSGKDAAPNSE